MAETTDRSRDNDITIRVAVRYHFARRFRVVGRLFGQLGCRGMLTNVSYPGALIESQMVLREGWLGGQYYAPLRPRIGERVVLEVWLEPPDTAKATTRFKFSSKLPGHVVRHSSNGFEMEYNDNVDSNVRRRLIEGAAIAAPTW